MTDNETALRWMLREAIGVAHTGESVCHDPLCMKALAVVARHESPEHEGLHNHDVPGVGTLWWDASGKIVGGPEND